MLLFLALYSSKKSKKKSITGSKKQYEAAQQFQHL